LPSQRSRKLNLQESDVESKILAQEITENLLDRLNVSYTITTTEENGITIDSPDHALLIGKKGDNLRSLQHLVNSIMKRQDPHVEWCVIDVAGYKKERIEKLRSIAESIAKEVITSGRPKRLPAMNSFERRAIHTYLAENNEVVTESEGQEPNRSIVVKKA